MVKTWKRVFLGGLICLSSQGSLAEAGQGEAFTQSGGSTIEEVLVTTQSSILSKLGGSGSFTVLDKTEIEAVAATHPQELLNRVAGVWVNRGSGQEHLTAMRSAVYTGSGACGEFLLLEDGIPIRPHGFCNINNLFELNTEQAALVEVLRGPASAELGGNALHGAVNVVTPVPRQTRLGLEIGPHDFHRVNVSAGTTLGAHQLGLSVVSSNTQGYRDATGYGQQKIHLSHLTRTSGWSVKNQVTATLLNQETGGYVGGFEAFDDPQLRRSNPNPEAYRDAWSLRLNSELTRGALTLKPYLRRSKMQFLQHFLPGQPLENNDQSSGGLLANYRLQGQGLTADLGAQVELMSGALREFQAGPTTGSPFLVETRPSGLHYDYDVDSLLFAGFYNLSWTLAEDLRLQHSLRLEHLSYDYTNHHIDGDTRDDGSVCGMGGCLYTRPGSREDDFSNLGARVAIERDIGSGLAYISASQGFRPPQVTELYRLRGGQTIADLNSEDLTAVEAGFKRSGVALAIFAEKTRNYIFRDSEAYNVSDGRTRSYGAEFSGSWALGRHEFSVASTYARHQYDFDREVTGRETVVNGNDMDSAPRFIGQARWHMQVSDALTQELEVNRVGAYYLNAANTAKYDGHYAVNWRMQWQLNERTELSLRVINLLDERYADRADFAFGGYRYFPAMPRQVYFGARMTLD